MLETPKAFLDFQGKTEKDVTMDNQQERQIFDIGWFIGLLDGEGCFSLGKYIDGKKKKPYMVPAIILANTNHEIIDKATQVLRSQGVSPYILYVPAKRAEIKPHWSLRIVGLKRLQHFMDKFYPFMECRKPQAEVLKKFIESRLSKPRWFPYTDEDFEFFDQLKVLNHRGKSESSETARRTSAPDEDTVRASTRVEEIGRDAQSAIA